MRAAFTTFATAVAWLGFTSQRVSSFEYDPRYVGYNLNENPNANGPLEYWGKWQDVSSILVSPCYIYIHHNDDDDDDDDNNNDDNMVTAAFLFLSSP